MLKKKNNGALKKPSKTKVNQGIYGMNANKSTITKERSYIPGSELTGTIK
jgi:hypothetical protein